MCDSTMMHENYRPDAEFDAEVYARSVNRFWCPVCNKGWQRPNVTAGLPHSEWVYECERCLATGTRKQLENSGFYQARIEPRTCDICGGEIHPHAARMQGDWWMLPSRVWVWRCKSCTFTGRLQEFTDEASRRETMPDYESHPTY